MMSYVYKPDQVVGDMLIISLEILTYNKKHYPAYLCKCICGEEMMIRQTYLKKNNTCLKNIKKENIKGWNSFFQSYINSAARKKKGFKLTITEFIHLCERRCCYCGKYPEERSLYSIVANGVDRIQNSIGYYVENCVPCCTACNMLKGEMNKKDFISLCKDISRYQTSRDELDDVRKIKNEIKEKHKQIRTEEAKRLRENRKKEQDSIFSSIDVIIRKK